MKVRKSSFVLAWVVCMLALLLTPSISYLQGAITLTIDEISDEDFPNMEVFVTVSDANGVPIQGLDKSDFEAIEDDTAVTIEDLDWRINEEEVIAVALVIDISGSMRGKPLSDAKKAAISFIDSLGLNDWAAVIAFSDKVDLGDPFPKIDPTKEMDFTLDHGALKNLISALEAKEKARTPLYDAAFKAVKMTAQQPIAKRAVILFTDGKEKTTEEKASIMGPEDPIREANRNRIPIFTIGLGKDIDPAYLKRVASGTGGTYEETPDSAKLTELFQKVIRLLKHQYIIRYTSQVLADGEEHNFLLKVKALGSEAKDKGVFSSRRITPLFALPSLPAELTGRTMVTLRQVTAQGGVAKVEYLLDGKEVFAASSVPCDYELDPALLSPGDHTLTVRVYDPAGNVGTGEVSFKVPGPVMSPVKLALIIVPVLIVMWAVLLLVLQRRKPIRETEFLTQVGLSFEEEIPPTEAPVQETMPGPEVAPKSEPTISLKPERRHLAWLVVEKGEHVGQEFKLLEGDTLIGRAETNDIVLDDLTVSRQQAKIRLEGKEFYIYDMGATNPTKVNGQEVTRQRLEDGDRIEIGNTVLVFKRA